MRRFTWFLATLLVGVGCGSEETTALGDASGGTGGGGGAAETAPSQLPAKTGTCPELVDGDVVFTPAGVAPRSVRIFMSPDAANNDGPLVFYWHGTGSSPAAEPPYGLGETLEWVKSQGGIVAAPHSDPAAGTFPWFLTTGGDDETDLLVADEILACAAEQVGIDTRRIHSIGMSAGGLQTTQMSYRRSSYLASVVTYSGGKIGDIPNQAEDNLFPAMIFHGGPNDVVIVNFKDLSEAYRDDLRGRDHFAFICDHGGGHTIPTGQGEQSAVKAFFENHPWGTTPSPFRDALPAGFPPYCAL